MDHNIYIIIIAIAVVALDIVVRVYAARGRRDWFYKALLEMQQGIASRDRKSTPRRVAADDLLSDALLAFFRQSFTSRQIMAALADSIDGIEGKQLEEKIAAHVAGKWNRQLSINAIRRVIMILMGANLVDLQSGKFALTDLGWKLFLKTKSPVGPRWEEAPDRSLVPAC